MGSSVRRWLIALGVGFLILFTLFVVNQIAQLAALAERVSPALGQFTLWTLVALCALCLFVPLYLVLRLPRTLVPPVSETDPGFPCYLQQLRQRLRRNPHLHQPELDTREQIEAALAELGEKADEVTRQTALQVLVSTAVLQNGSLKISTSQSSYNPLSAWASPRRSAARYRAPHGSCRWPRSLCCRAAPMPSSRCASA